MEQKVTIEVFGQPYTFKAETGTVDPKEVADYFVQEVKKAESQLSGQTANLNKQTILILAALNIANQTYLLRKSHSDLLKDVSNRSTNLLRALDAALP